MSISLAIKKGDTVLVVKGKNRGKKGKVLQVLTSRSAVLIDGANEKIRHVRPKSSGQKGQKVTVNHPIRRANVMIVCPSCSKGTRIGFKSTDEGKKVRVCKKCGGDIS